MQPASHEAAGRKHEEEEDKDIHVRFVSLTQGSVFSNEINCLHVPLEHRLPCSFLAKTNAAECVLATALLLRQFWNLFCLKGSGKESCGGVWRGEALKS